MRFKKGDLVKCLFQDRIDLYDECRFATASTGSKVVSWLQSGDIALVIQQDNFSGTMIYVLGPNGLGWAFAAFLQLNK